MKRNSTKSFSRSSWAFLVYVLLVISWGAFVRATGSGAGCGNHWPLCNGEVLPRTHEVETLIEFTHRLTSGLALVGIVLLAVWAFRLFERGSPVRKFALISLFFMLTEAIVGAGLVIFGLVADDDSLARAWVMAFHLVNTYLLVGAIALMSWLSDPGSPGRFHFPQRIGTVFLLIVSCQLILGASGAVAALGDTLFPSESLAGAIEQDFSPHAHLLIRLRVYHPLIAATVALLTVIFSARIALKSAGARLNGLAMAVGALFLLQIGVGIVNLLLLAPVWLQLLHLLMADLIWIATVLLGARLFSEPARIEDRLG